jgi:anthranilate phosphoribosyltransferase
VLEALGVNLNVTPEKVEECISKIGIGFLFAPSLHGAMKYAIGPRRQIGIRTIFNILGPLTNPANATAQILGVYDEKLVETLAGVLKNLGTRKAWVVHGKDGLDEISVSAETVVAELSDGKINLFNVNPEAYGIKKSTLTDLKGGTAADNALIIRKVLGGEKGPKRDIVLLNAAAGLCVGGVTENIQDGLKLAQKSIDSGAAKEKLELLIKITNE